MSDQSPPPKPKVGSLRDRIAAFEKGGTSSGPAGAPPPPRPKPGNLAWKPKPPSPPSSPGRSSIDQAEKKAAGMSAADAKESITKGGSLRERMAALQGKGAFGGGAAPAPPPKPAVEKPKWKPPPAPIAPPPAEDDEAPVAEEPVKSPPIETAHPEEDSKPTVEDAEAKEDVGGDEGQVDPEEEERQRRAAIAARMARLGGARFGMAPPVFGKKPDVKKPHADIAHKEIENPREEVKPAEVHEADQAPEHISVKSPPTEEVHVPETVPQDEGYFKETDALSTSSPHLSPEPTPASSVRSPSHMPVPAVPRRAGPPRKRVAKSPAPPVVAEEPKVEPPHEAPVEAIVEPVVEEAIAPTPEAEKQEDVLEPDVAEVVPPPTHEEEVKPVISPETSQEPTPHEDDISAIGASHPNDEVTDLSEPTEEIKPATEPSPVQIAEPPVPLPSASHDVTEAEETPEESHPEPETPPHVQHEEEEEEDDETRRRRVAERLARMGGINPFAASMPRSPPISPPPPPPTATRPESKRQSSLGFAAAQSLPSSPAIPERRTSILKKDSIDSPALGRRVSTSSKKSIDSGVVHAEPEPETFLTTSPPPVAEQAPVRKESVQEELEEDRDESVASHVQPAEPVDAASNEVDEEHEEPQQEPSIGGDTSEYSQSENGEGEGPLEEEDIPSHQISHEEDVEGPTAHDFDEDEGGYEHTPVLPPARSVPPPPPLPNFSSRPSFHAEEEEEESHAFTEPVPPPPRPSIPPPSRVARPPAEDLAPVEAHPPRRSLPPPPPPPPAAPAQEEDFEVEDEHPQEYDTHEADVESEDIQESDEGHAEEEAPPPLPPARRTIPPPPQHREEVSRPIPQVASPPPLPPSRPPAPTSKRPIGGRPLSMTIPKESPPPQHPPPPPPAPLAIDTNSDHEIMDDADGDPIDPHFHSPQKSSEHLPRSPSSVTVLEPAAPAPAPEHQESVPSEEPVEDPELTRRRTIAERMAKLGGIKFGAPPPIRRPQQPPPPPPQVPADSAEEETSPGQEEGAAPATHEQQDAPVEEEEEESEQARRQRIAARLANMGGMRFGMLPGAAPQQPPTRPHREPSVDKHTVSSPPPAPRAVPPARPPPPPHVQSRDLGHESETDDGVKVEAEESELEEVTYDDVQDEEEAPPVPSREHRRGPAVPILPADPVPPTSYHPPPPARRPPVPTVPAEFRARQASGASRRSSSDSSYQHSPVMTYPPRPPPVAAHSDYVMVDDPEDDNATEEEVATPPPPPRPAHRPPPSRSAPAMPPPTEPSQSIAASQWELPSIPSGALDFGGASDLSASAWSEDSTTYPSSPPPPPIQTAPSKRRSTYEQPSGQTPVGASTSKPQVEVHRTSEELMSVWGKVGVQVCEVATTLYEKSRKSLVGDGTYAGFVEQVLSQVPNAVLPTPPSYGYLVYAQTGSTVTKRASDILPGDIMVALDAKLQGHKGIQKYHQNIGVGELFVAVVSDFEMKKSKVKVFQANQHVGQQSVEGVSYRLEDLKAGTIQIFRVMEA